jgi:GT2 family glycosyltransferase
VLEQDPGAPAMQIALVDDGSRRIDPRTCVPVGARGRVAWLRHERHLGISGNWNACIEQAHGDWVHILHQDDLVRPGFYARMRALIEAFPSAGAAFCRDTVIDSDDRTLAWQHLIRATPGIVDDWVEHLFVGLHLRASALVVRRRVYETLGGFRRDLGYALDWDMWKRIAVAYPLVYEPEALACYRRHADSASIGFQRSGDNLAEIGRSIALSEADLPPSIAAAVTRRTRDSYCRYAARLAWDALAKRDVRTALAQLRGARALGSSRLVARELATQVRRACARVLPAARAR